MGLQSLLKKLEVPHPEGHALSGLQNPDLEPMPEHRRIWGLWSFAGYYGVLNISVWTFSVGSSLLSLGLNIQHAMGALTIGNIFIVLYTCLNSSPGQTYHIGYTVCQRFVFGIYGSSMGILIRFILGIVYYGSQAWLGGLCVVVMLSSMSESYLNMENTFSESVAMTTRDFIGFLVFHIISIPFLWVKPERLNVFVNISCVMAFFGLVAVMVYLLCINGGPGPIYHQPVELSSSETGWMWLYAMSIWYGALSPDITNQSDYSRFSSGSKKLIAGVFVGIFFTEIIPLAGLISASCSVELYGTEYWLPTDICLQWLQDNYSPRMRCACFFLGFSFMSSELSLNVVSNAVACGLDAASIMPKYINVVRGSLLCASLSWVVQPWTFYNTSSTFSAVMSSFGIIVTPIIGILVSDFTLVRKNRLRVNDLYSTSKEGDFYFTAGVNWRAIFVFFATVTPGLPGMAAATNSDISLKTNIINYYYGSILFSFFFPLALYYIVARWIFPIQDAGVSDGKDYYNAFTSDECLRLNLEPYDGADGTTGIELIEGVTGSSEDVEASTSTSSVKGKYSVGEKTVSFGS
ncbi:Thiamine transporter [Cyberlindnera fabianii]|uniref:Thiamine transporter n=1 Tax=Cyberlindnera fabianii TaxID=36022 RepID=A0A1V2L898_CYBFA|nr:Thiamine transporter [Cyberlindnera fabianii]